jgi:hypothetical protein
MELHPQDTFFSQFLNDKRYEPQDIEAIEKTVAKLTDISSDRDRPGMLLGKIQSGKTKTFIGIIGLAFDRGFDAAIILTKGTKALSKQTIERISKEFEELTHRDLLQAYDVMTKPENLMGYEISQKLIFVAKKQPDNMARLIKTFSQEQFKNKNVLIIDDEADYASVGFKRTKEEGIESNTTTKQIDELRKLIQKSSFLQVTATPYSLYLQPESIELHGLEYRPIKPAFTQLVPINKSYIGGDYYFNDSLDENNLASYLYVPIKKDELEILQKSDRRRFKVEEVLTSNAILSLRQAIIGFLVGGCIRRIQDEHEGLIPSKYSFLIHTESQKGAHAWQEEVITELYRQLQESALKESPICDKLISEAYEEFVLPINLESYYLPPKDKVATTVKAALAQGWLMITKVNSEKQIEELLDATGQLKLRTPLNIFIGGQILDRGVTISNLIGFYYGRRPKTYQQDTVLQHSRMYGFRPRKDLAVTRFYTEPAIYQAMKAMHECDTELRKSFEDINGDQSVVFIRKDEGGKIRACSPNKILLSRVNTLKPHKRLLPVGFQTNFASYLKTPIAAVDKYIQGKNVSIDNEEPFLIDVEDAIILIRKIQTTLLFKESGYDFDWDAYEAIIRYLSSLTKADSYKNKVWCLVRSNRNLSRSVAIGSHAKFSDAPDTTRTDGSVAKELAIETPVLILIKQNGEESRGWMGHPFYWPVLYAQHNLKTVIFSSETQDD